MVKERTEIHPSCLKVAEEEVVWRAFTEFYMPGKVVRANRIRHYHWVKLYDETNGQNNLRAKQAEMQLVYSEAPADWARKVEI